MGARALHEEAIANIYQWSKIVQFWLKWSYRLYKYNNNTDLHSFMNQQLLSVAYNHSYMGNNIMIFLYYKKLDC